MRPSLSYPSEVRFVALVRLFERRHTRQLCQLFDATRRVFPPRREGVAEVVDLWEDARYLQMLYFAWKH